MFCSDKGDRRKRVEWLPPGKFDKVQLALLLLTSSRHYKALLTKENLIGVRQHPNKISHHVLPWLKFSSYNFNQKVHKVYKHLDGVFGENKGVEEPRSARVGLHEGPAPGAKREKMRREEEQSRKHPEMKKKLVLILVVLEFDFADEEVIPATLAVSLLDVAAQRVRRQSSVRGGVSVDVLVAEVAPL